MKPATDQTFTFLYYIIKKFTFLLHRQVLLKAHLASREFPL